MQRNSVRSLEIHITRASRTFLPQTLLASQSQSLTSLDLYDICLELKSVLLMPNLRDLHLSMCRVEGWDNLLRSVPALKDIRLYGVIASGNMTAFTASSLLEGLFICSCSGLKVSGEPWHTACSASFANLRRLSTDAISDGVLTTFLHNSIYLEELSISERVTSVLMDELLPVICRRARSSLRSLTLWGNFSQQGLERFIASFPDSITDFSLTLEIDLTLSQFRTLLRLPLRILDLSGNAVSRKDLEEMQGIEVTMYSPDLKLCMDDLIVLSDEDGEPSD